MTRVATGVISAAFLNLAVILVSYALTADASTAPEQLPQTAAAIAIECQPPFETPIPMGSAAAARAAFELAAQRAFAPRRGRH